MKITKEQLRHLIKEEYEGITIGSLPVGNPTQWAHMSDQLRQMSRVWANAEDGKFLELAADALRRAVDIENQRGEDILKR
jgi:uncharacterized membrane-anchored protein